MIVGLVSKIGGGKDTVAQMVQEMYPELNWQIKGFADKLRQVAPLLTGIPSEDMKKQEVKETMLGEEWGERKDRFNYYNNGPWVSLSDVGVGPNDFVKWNECWVYTKITLRTFLQRLGTEAIRDGLNKNAWCNALMCDYNNIGPYKWNPGNYANVCLECTSMFYNGAKLQRVCEECCKLVGAKYPNWLVTDCRFPNELEAITSRGGICIRIVRPGNPHPQSNHESETALDDVELLTIINDGSLEQLRLRVKEVFDPIVKNLGK